jgi:putative nucleotidyltransferase with HDIG domain
MRPSLDSYRKVSAERIRDEWTKSLRASKSSRAFRIMREQGLLDVTAPELVQLHQCSQNRHHHYDVWEHTLGTVDRVPPKSSQLRLAALFHDIGKPSVRATSPESGDYTFHNHEISGAHITDVVMRRLKFPNDLRERVVSLVRYHLVVHDSQWTDAAVRRWIGRITPDLVNDILELARCDVAAKGLDASLQLQALAILDLRVKAILASNHALSFKDLVVTGTDLMQELGIQPGPVIGQLLRHLLEEVIEAPEHNERERLLNRSRELLKSFASVVADPSFRSRGD